MKKYSRLLVCLTLFYCVYVSVSAHITSVMDYKNIFYDDFESGELNDYYWQRHVYNEGGRIEVQQIDDIFGTTETGDIGNDINITDVPEGYCVTFSDIGENSGAAIRFPSSFKIDFSAGPVLVQSWLLYSGIELGFLITDTPAIEEEIPWEYDSFKFFINKNEDIFTTLAVGSPFIISSVVRPKIAESIEYPISRNIWYHYAMEFTPTEDSKIFECKVYINGKLFAETLLNSGNMDMDTMYIYLVAFNISQSLSPKKSADSDEASGCDGFSCAGEFDDGPPKNPIITINDGGEYGCCTVKLTLSAEDESIMTAYISNNRINYHEEPNYSNPPSSTMQTEIIISDWELDDCTCVCGVCEKKVYAYFTDGTDETDLVWDTIKLLNPDYNNDGCIGLGDLVLFGDQWSSVLGDINWDPCYDLNGDGTITVGDLALFGKCWGHCYSTPKIAKSLPVSIDVDVGMDVQYDKSASTCLANITVDDIEDLKGIRFMLSYDHEALTCIETSITGLGMINLTKEIEPGLIDINSYFFDNEFNSSISVPFKSQGMDKNLEFKLVKTSVVINSTEYIINDLPTITVNASPTTYLLVQNYPNPFNPITTISYQLNQAGMVNVTVYDLFGRKVATLIDEMKSPGSYSVRWNAQGYASGVYFYRIKTGDSKVLTQKMMLMK